MNKENATKMPDTRDIFLSIKPKFANLIACKEKNYEFRRYKPKHSTNRVFFYITSPVCELKYIAEVGEVVEYPSQLTKTGVGNEEFNRGQKISKFAFPILHLYELAQGVSLMQLKNLFKFNPPQGYIYTDTFPKLTKRIETCKRNRLY